MLIVAYSSDRLLSESDTKPLIVKLLFCEKITLQNKMLIKKKKFFHI